jgi:hypothetical protein
MKKIILIKNKDMEALREFRGYLNGRLLYTFPLHWVDNVKVKDGVMVVSYFDEMQYNTETGLEPLVEIRVDEINIK